MTGITVNELPSWLPWANLVLSLAALVLLLPLVARRRRAIQSGKPSHPSRWWIATDVALVFSVLVLVAGAMFQGGLMSIGDWTIVGTGGRALVVVALLLVLSVGPDEYQ